VCSVLRQRPAVVTKIVRVSEDEVMRRMFYPREILTRNEEKYITIISFNIVRLMK
jgi:hypothetical protein